MRLGWNGISRHRTKHSAIATNMPTGADATHGRHRTLLLAQRDLERLPESLYVGSKMAKAVLPL
jgi:hypothetical protein